VGRSIRVCLVIVVLILVFFGVSLIESGFGIPALILCVISLVIIPLLPRIDEADKRHLNQEKLQEQKSVELLAEHKRQRQREIDDREIEHYSKKIEAGELNSAPHYLSDYVRNALESKLESRRRTENSKNRIVRCAGICSDCRRDKCLEDMYNNKGL
jgi:hypothetical protein